MASISNRFAFTVTSGVKQRNAEFLRSPAGNRRRTGYALGTVNDDLIPGGLSVKLHQELLDRP